MPYVTDRRYSGSLKSEYTSTFTGGSERLIVDSGTEFELTYGYRTGGNADHVKPDPRDVYLPPKGANLAEVLKYRKEFMERTITKIQIDASSSAPTHFILSDLGNEYSNVRIRGSVTPNTARQISSGVTKNWVNACAYGSKWIQTGGVMGGVTTPFIDFMGFLSSKGTPEFLGAAASSLSLSDAAVLSTAAIKEMNPIQVHASVLTTLLELVRGDVPGILKNLRQHFANITNLKYVSKNGLKDSATVVGGSFLENVFGWQPILRDVNSSIQVLTTLDALLFPEDNTRRTFNRVISENWGTSESSVSRLSGFGLFNPLGGVQNRGTAINWSTGSDTANATSLTNIPATYTAKEVVDFRCTARFNTGLVPNDRNNGHLDRLQELLGLQLTPQVLWDLTPWSWLIDWFANIGTVVENISNLHMSNIILNYAYSTCRSNATSGVWQRPTVITSGSGIRAITGNFITTYSYDQKVRLKASPYGFGAALSSLNGNQWAILVALGLARAR